MEDLIIIIIFLRYGTFNFDYAMLLANILLVNLIAFW